MVMDEGGTGRRKPDEEVEEARTSTTGSATQTGSEGFSGGVEQGTMLTTRQPDNELLSVRLPIFEGPLDLLLHLVREHRLDIFDIPIAFITEKYLEMIDRMRELNLDVAGEFIVMAATLAHIKSRMLLPRPETDEDGDETGDEGDPRSDLVRRLLQYQKYREAADSLGGQDILGRDVFVREARSEAPPPPEGDIGVRQVGVFKLVEALDSVLARAKVEVSHEVIRERLSLSERITQMVEMLEVRQRIVFLEIFENNLHREAIIITFLALLEMSRLGLARITQDEPDGDILIVSTERTGAGGPAEVIDDFQ